MAEITRRQFLKLLGGLSAGTLGVLETGFALFQPLVVSGLAQAHNIRLNRTVISHPHLPPAFEGVKLALISDLHIGPYMTVNDAERAVELANQASGDILFMLGDFISRARQYISPLVTALASLDYLQDGRPVYAILGNHDYWVDAEAVTQALTELGVIVLVNEARIYARGESTMGIYGVGDLWCNACRLEEAKTAIPPPDFRILLCHNPDIIYAANSSGFDLVLSGHTHGGQVVLPIIGPPNVPSKYGKEFASGLHRVGETALFVSRGVGTITPPIRINCPAEVNLLTLTRE